ncbi:hypothetical protein E1508_10860 [Pseudomonas moraviensis]|nr:hypothetical protein E1508_10860 [Pseudomonas moraviensis]
MQINAVHVGASLLAKALYQTLKWLNVPASSRAGSLPQGLGKFRPFGTGAFHDPAAPRRDHRR